MLSIVIKIQHVKEFYSKLLVHTHAHAHAHARAHTHTHTHTQKDNETYFLSPRTHTYID